MSESLHNPTTAGPTPSAQEKVADAASTAQAKVTDAAATAQTKVTDVAATAQTVVSEKPEVQVGLAFAGAFLAAKVLKAIGR